MLYNFFRYRCFQETHILVGAVKLDTELYIMVLFKF